jgi:cytochrome c oxidase assembly factor CtaG
MSETAWLSAVELAGAAIPLAAYAVVMRRARLTASGWPAARAAAFAAAVVLFAAATSATVDDHARRSAAWHMGQQMTLLLVVPPALVAARPLELWRRVTGRRPWPRPGAAVSWLAFVGVQWIVHLPPVLDALVRHPAAEGAGHIALVAAGAAFFGQVTAPRGWLANPLVLALYVVSAMPTTDAIALWLILDPHAVYSAFGASGALAGQRTAGVIMFGAGNILLVAAAAIAGRYLWDGRPHPAAVPTART